MNSNYHLSGQYKSRHYFKYFKLISSFNNKNDPMSYFNLNSSHFRDEKNKI